MNQEQLEIKQSITKLSEEVNETNTLNQNKSNYINMLFLVSHQCDTNLQTNSSLKYYNNVNRVLVLGTGIGLESWGKTESRTRPRPWKYGLGLRQTPEYYNTCTACRLYNILLYLRRCLKNRSGSTKTNKPLEAMHYIDFTTFKGCKTSGLLIFL